MMRIRLPIMVVAAALMLGGCTAVEEATEAPPVRAPYGQPGFQAAVDVGDTVGKLARRYNVPPAALIRANNLRAPYRLKAGQVLMVPPPPTYIVKPGDTVAGIATDLGVDEVALAQANGLSRPYHMRVGQVLRVPGGIGPDGEIIDENPEVAMVPPEITPRSSITSRSLAPPKKAPQMPAAPAESPAPAAGAQYPGPSAAAPGPQVGVGVTTTVLAPPPQYAAPAPATVAPAAAIPLPAASAPVKQAPVKQAAVQQPPPTAGQPRFSRPVGGQVIVPFGPDGSGQNNDGINIAASAGAPVRAAEAGTVIYTGNELAAFGNLILIRHPGGWVTAYGHLASISVQKGATVSQGQQVGTVGKTGSVTSPQLHFEIRRDGKPVDPAPYLGG